MITKKRPLIELETALKNIPVQWLRYIEPRIVRQGTCWLWQGACDDRGEPFLNFKNLGTGKRNTRRLKIIVAEMFWEMKRHYDVVHECGNMNCLNPAHFYISAAHYTQENREKMVKEKQTSIRRYEAEKKSD